jgi:hydroxymethylpyrimidine/phosphomethylpyrimidine kinase
VSYLPLPAPGTTPLRVLTIAGSDSGGGAGIQADMPTMALLGVHARVAVTAVTVQNTLGVKSFHGVPDDVVAGQIAAVAATWRRLELSVPLVVDPVCASMHGDPLLVDIEVVDSTSQRAAAKALHALGPRWALVKGGHLRSSDRSRDLLYGGPSEGADFHEFDAERVNTGNDHGGGDTLATAIACALAHGFSVPDAVGFGKRWVTECLRAAYPLGHGHGPVSPLFRLC